MLESLLIKWQAWKRDSTQAFFGDICDIFKKTPILKNICEQLLLFVLSEITFGGDGYEGKKYFESISLNNRLKSVFASYRQKKSITSLICYPSSQQVGKLAVGGWTCFIKASDD